MNQKQPENQQSLIIQRHNVFVRSARDAAHQVLYFLGMLYPPNCEAFGRDVKDYHKTALHQIMGIVRGVYVPSFIQEKSKVPEASDPDNTVIPDSQVPRELDQVANIKAEWQKLRDNLSWDGALDHYPFEKIPELREEVTNFLRNSRAKGKIQGFFEHSLPDAFRWLCRHLSLFLAAALVVWVSLGVEAVKGLLWNEGRWKLLFYIVFLPLPFYIHRWIDYRMRKGGTIFWLSLASLPFWRFRPLAIGPGRMIQRWPDQQSILGAIGKGQLIKILVYFCLSLLSVCAIYGIQWFLDVPSALTTPCILLIFYLILLAANQLDFWDFIFYAPLRSITLLLVACLLIGLQVGWGRPTFIVVLAGIGVILVALYIVTKRWKKTLLGFGVVAAVLALFTILGWHTDRERIWRSYPHDQFERLTCDKWPHRSSNPVVLLTASGGGSRAAVYTGLTLERLNLDYPEIARQLQAISSVSGGSLANAAYIARLLSAGAKGRAQSLEGMVDALSSDFLFPTLVGAVVPFKSRGASIEEEWQKGKVGLGDYSMKNLAERWEDAKSSDAPPFPIPLFNTATLEAHDLVISPLKSDYYTNMKQHSEARIKETNLYNLHKPTHDDDGPSTWVYYRHSIYGLENLLPKQNLLLSSAVLASANFPFGFPVVKIEPAKELTDPLYFSPKPDPRPSPVKLTDGGALSNSGMWSLFNLLVNKKAELAERGVLLIVVEASKMPEYDTMNNTFNRLLGTIDDQTPIGRNLHELMFSYLEELYEGRLATVQLDLTPCETKNIMTTWALDKKSLENLKKDFNDRWAEKKECIGKLWDHLHRKEKGNPKADYLEKSCELIDRERLPLD